jgi:hypothetical protein
MEWIINTSVAFIKKNNSPVLFDNPLYPGYLARTSSRKAGLAARKIGGYRLKRFFYVRRMAPSFGRLCGKPSGLPVPISGLLTRTVAYPLLAVGKAVHIAKLEYCYDLYRPRFSKHHL